MASKQGDIPLATIEKSKPNGDSEATPYGCAVVVDGGEASEKLLDGNHDDTKAAKAAKAAMAARLASNEFAGLSKDELAKFAKDPYWRKVRIILFALFWCIWVALLVAAIVIIIVTPKCPPRPDVPFYQKDAVYKVLPLSFSDKQNGDGWGHLIGLKQRLPYIKSLGVSTISIGPVFSAETKANALYDSTGNEVVDTNIGHFSPCLQELSKDAAKQGIKLLVEAQVNFASVKHPKFRAQLTSQDPTKGMFIVRAASSATSTITARDGASAWREVPKDSEVKGDYKFYSSFTANVVELDFTNEEAVTYALNMVKTLVKQDIDGVIIKDASFLTECSDLATVTEETQANDTADFTNAYWKVAHPCIMNLNTSAALVRRFADVIAKRNAEEDRRKRVLLVELAGVRSLEEYASFVGSGSANGALVDTLTHVGYAPAVCDLQCVRRRIEAVASKCVQKRDAASNFPLWHFSTPEYGRLTTRFGDKSAAAFFALGALLPGGFGAYYGDEVGVADVNVTRDQLDKLFFSGSFRSTMQWSAAEPYAGFLQASKPGTSLDPGLDGPSNAALYRTANVDLQLAAGYGESRADLFKKLLAVKQSSESAQWGTFYSLTNALVGNAPALKSSLIAFARVAIGFDPVVVVLNGLGDATSEQVGSVALDKAVCGVLKTSAEWATELSSNPKLFSCSSGTVLFSNGGNAAEVGATLPLANVYVGPNQVLVVRIPRSA